MSGRKDAPSRLESIAVSPDPAFELTESRALLRSPDDVGEEKPSIGRLALLRTRCTPRVVEGMILLFIVNVIWVGSSEMVQYIYKDLDFNKPFFLTYVSNSLFMLLGPGQWGLERAQANGRCIRGHEPPLPSTSSSIKQTAKVAMIISPMWFLAQGSYNWSLNSTSVASSTILSTTSCLFTMLFSVCFLKERVTITKILGVAVTISGAVCVGLNDRNSGTDHIYGDAICLFSAVMYGVYTTAIRYYIPDESHIKMAYFFAFLGAINAVFLMPLVLVMHYTGIESLLSLTVGIFCFLVMKGMFDNVLSDMLWARSIMLTSPTVATVGLALTIPLSLLADWMLKGQVPKALLLLGSLLVLFGFVAVSVDAGAPRPEDRPELREPSLVELLEEGEEEDWEGEGMRKRRVDIGADKE